MDESERQRLDMINMISGFRPAEVSEISMHCNKGSGIYDMQT